VDLEFPAFVGAMPIDCAAAEYQVLDVSDLGLVVFGDGLNFLLGRATDFFRATFLDMTLPKICAGTISTSELIYNQSKMKQAPAFT
jgi:hypothetical protein